MNVKSRHIHGQMPATYVHLGDCYINNATHNNQGVKCIPCITEIVLHVAEKPRKKRKKQREEKGRERYIKINKQNK